MVLGNLERSDERSAQAWQWFSNCFCSGVMSSACYDERYLECEY